MFRNINAFTNFSDNYMVETYLLEITYILFFSLLGITIITLTLIITILILLCKSK